MSVPTGHIFENLEMYFILSLYRKWDSKALTHFSSYEIKLLPQRLYWTISGEGFFSTRNRNTKSRVWKKNHMLSVVPQRKQQQLLDRLGRDLLKHSPAASSASQSEERSYWTVPHLYLPIKYVQCSDWSQPGYSHQIHWVFSRQPYSCQAF